ncbi:ATP-grasp domain-containing protein [Duganella callida]|uniref:RimK family alpha-L-glutamate ligase n=1 Tax=Duganella callida TaxID=2561932 RepID=A0A4Y9SNN0_9BURK|nr:RimK family alpha-L-glutamate ligase [Duganella callida]TFW27107.1 RimK family alpha-L-glutamate ligase [Duganella callida]
MTFDAIGQHNAPLIGVAPLMRRAFAGEDLTGLGQTLLQRAQTWPNDAHAYMDFSTVLQLTGNRADALAVQAEAITLRQHYTLPARQPGPGLTLLVLMGPGDLMSNTPVEFLVEDSDVTLELLYLRADEDFPEQVPEHDVMLVAVAESEANQPLLARLTEYVSDWPRPVINRPEHIRVLSRDGVCAALRGLAGVEMPVSVRTDRGVLNRIAAGLQTVEALLGDGGFPIIVRPLGSHAGTNLEKVDTPEALGIYLQTVEGLQFYISRFVDYRSADGLFRKYRVALIEGVPYICHFAISQRWMIHYLNAGMTESADKRAEEAACMAGFDQGFALRHQAALRAIDQRMQLPYLGIDCAEMPNGDLLIFEADNAMIVHGMDPVDMFPYKQPAMRKVFDAFRALLERAAGRGING